MKQSYLSLVLHWSSALEAETLRQIDRILSRVAEAHEIVIVAGVDDIAQIPLASLSGELGLASPVSVVVPRANATHDAAMLAGVSRAVGDFVIEWDSSPTAIKPSLLEDLLEATDSGAEIVELVPPSAPRQTTIFYRLANVMRPKSLPLRQSVARLLSRRAIDMMLRSNTVDPLRPLLIADSALPRVAIERHLKLGSTRSYRNKLADAIRLLIRGTRFGTYAPLVLALASALVAVAAAVYAIVIFFASGKTPEGWTTLMVFCGFGFAAVMLFLGMLWIRVDHLFRIQTRSPDETAQVIVLPPVAVSTDISH